MKILSYGDVHLRDFGSYAPFNQVESNGLTRELNNIIRGFKFIADQIKLYKPALVVNHGDTYQNTEVVSATCIHATDVALSMVRSACEDVGAVHIYVHGNHDFLNENLVITNVATLPGYFHEMHLSSSMLVHEGVSMFVIPYSSNLSAVTEFLCRSQMQAQLGLAHLDFYGALYESGTRSQSQLSPDLVTVPLISGDLHVAHSVGNVHYPGSLVQSKFSRYDLDLVGGVLLFDTDTNKVTRVPNTYSKHYVKVTDLNKIFDFSPDSVVLQIVSSKPFEEVEPFIKDYDYVYTTSRETPQDVSSSVYVQEEPSELLRSYILEDRPDSIADFDKVMQTE